MRRKEMGGGAYLRVVGVVPTALVEEETMLFFSLGDARIVVWTLRSLGSMSDIVGCCQFDIVFKVWWGGYVSYEWRSTAKH